MAAILSDYILKCIFLNEYDRIPIQISMKFPPDGTIDNNPAYIGLDKSLSEPMLTLFTNACTRYYGEMS